MRAAVEGIKPLNKYLERIKQLRIPTGEGTTMTRCGQVVEFDTKIESSLWQDGAVKSETFREHYEPSTIARTIRCLQGMNITDNNSVMGREKKLHNTSTGPFTTLFCATLLSRLRSLERKWRKGISVRLEIVYARHLQCNKHTKTRNRFFVLF